jgi:hypothetical protein
LKSENSNKEKTKEQNKFIKGEQYLGESKTEIDTCKETRKRKREGAEENTEKVTDRKISRGSRRWKQT